MCFGDGLGVWIGGKEQWKVGIGRAWGKGFFEGYGKWLLGLRCWKFLHIVVLYDIFW